MKINAVIEDITTKGIVILLGEEEKEITIHKDKLRHISGYNVGDWLDVIFEKGKITSVQLNQEKTDKVKKRVQEKMDMLRQRGRTK